MFQVPPSLSHSIYSSAKVLAKTFLTCMLWGLVMQFMAGYVFLHCWNNLSGELLRFADREFYSVKHHSKKALFHCLGSLLWSCLPLRTGGHVPHSPSFIASGICLFMTGLGRTFTKISKMYIFCISLIEYYVYSFLHLISSCLTAVCTTKLPFSQPLSFQQCFMNMFFGLQCDLSFQFSLLCLESLEVRTHTRTHTQKFCNINLMNAIVIFF